MKKQRQAMPTTPPIRPTGIIFALAATLLSVTIGDLIVTELALGTNGSAAVRLLFPFLAGIITAYYVGPRGAIHAFIGGMLSVPLLALAIMPGAWQVSLIAGAVCALGGAITEVGRRKKS